MSILSLNIVFRGRCAEGPYPRGDGDRVRESFRISTTGAMGYGDQLPGTQESGRKTQVPRCNEKASLERKNDRPVAILSSLSKILEKFVYEQLYEYFSSASQVTDSFMI